MIFNEKALANFVPAAAVIRKGLVLFRIIWRKTYVECFCIVISQNLKYTSLNSFLNKKLRV